MFYHIGHFISMFHSGPLSTEEHNDKYGRDHLNKKRRLQANRAKVFYWNKIFIVVSSGNRDRWVGFSFIFYFGFGEVFIVKCKHHHPKYFFGFDVIFFYELYASCRGKCRWRGDQLVYCYWWWSNTKFLVPTKKKKKNTKFPHGKGSENFKFQFNQTLYWRSSNKSAGSYQKIKKRVFWLQ